MPPACHQPGQETASDRAAWISSDYHGNSFASELTKRCASDSLEKLAGADAEAQVDSNPHQVDAVLFAFYSPLSKGALLAVVADHLVQGRVIFPGAGYMEMARAAAVALSKDAKGATPRRFGL